MKKSRLLIIMVVWLCLLSACGTKDSPVGKTNSIEVGNGNKYQYADENSIEDKSGLQVEDELQSGVYETYNMQVDDAERLIVPHLQLEVATQTFSFSYSMISSYLPRGEYEVNDGILTARTDDGLNTYLFEIVDESTIKFIEEGSSDVVPIDEKMEMPVIDQAVFKLERTVDDNN